MRSYFPTKHAAQAMSQRDVTWAEILEVLASPEVVYAGDRGAHAGKDSEIHQRGELYVVVGRKPTFDYYDTGQERPLYAVITVGLRSDRQWNNDDMRRRNQPASS